MWGHVKMQIWAHRPGVGPDSEFLTVHGVGRGGLLLPVMRPQRLCCVSLDLGPSGSYLI